MHIEKLSLINFRNYAEASLKFSSGINCLLGVNGSGKTNLIDAIYYLSMTKSAFNSIDSQNIKFDEQLFSIRGLFKKNEKQHDVVCAYQEGKKKIVKSDGQEYEKLSQHIGKFPVIIVAPNDTDLVRDGSEVRRKFFDSALSQIDNLYLDNLIKYNRYLKHRNSLLKQFEDTRKFDPILLEPYDQKLIELGQVLYDYRKRFIKDFNSTFVQQYNILSDEKEVVEIKYMSDYSRGDFSEHFKDAMKKDRVLQRTTMGAHKDEFKFLINGKTLKKFGSQGQQKTFVLGIKLALFYVLMNVTNAKPIVLLDDIFDKLDSNRINRLLQLIQDHTFGQVFITDAREDRTKPLFENLDIDANYYYISEGMVNDEEERK